MKRKRTASALLLVAAFALGVLTARAQAGDLFLPLVARAETEQETPTATPTPTSTPTPTATATATPTPTVAPSATVRVVNLHHYVSGATHYFLGEVVNETAYTIGIGDVTINLFDLDGVLVGTVRVGCLHDVIPPGERVPFGTYESSLWPFVSLTSTVPWWQLDYLTIERKELTKTGDHWAVTALVRNQLPFRVDRVLFGAVLYGSSGHVIGYDSPWTESVDLGPGEVLQTTHTFYSWDWDTSLEPVGCAVFAVPSGRGFYLLTEQEHEQTDSE